MVDQYEISLIGGKDNEAAIFTLFDNEPDCRLLCEFRGIALESTASDFFAALCDVRARLAEYGLTPQCYGASLNVYPSGMARDMGSGLKAFKLTVGQHAKMVDLVEIFADGPDVVPATVEAQEKFWRDWLAAPRS